jgi:hypothetical protein
MYKTQFRETALPSGQIHGPSATVYTLDMGSELKSAIRHYERHVIAWHALGRVSEARAARARIEWLRRAAGL